MERVELLTVDEVAIRLKCHPQTVRRWIWSGKLRHVKAGGLVRVPENAIRLLLEDGARPADGNDRRTGVAALRATMESSKENVTSKDVEDLTRVIREGEQPAEWNSPVD